MRARRCLGWLLAAGVFTSAAAATVSGRVVDSQEQQAFGGALVQAGAREGRTDSHGFFRIEGVDAGAVVLQVRLQDGRRFQGRLLVREPSAYVELDQSRHAPPDEDATY